MNESTHKVRIELNLVLPAVQDELDACVRRLISDMEHHKGIDRVHLIPAERDQTALLCFHYDPDVVALDRLQQLVREAGALYTDRYKHLHISANNIHDMLTASTIEREIAGIAGIVSVSISATGNMSLEYDAVITDRESILSALLTHGLELNKDAGAVNKHTVGRGYIAWIRSYASVIKSFIMLIVGVAADSLWNIELFSGWIRFLWYVVAYLPVGYPVATKGWKLLTKGDVFTEYILMTVATMGAFYIGEYPEAVAVMLFYTVGEIFQDAAVNRVKKSIKALLDVRPSTATVLYDGRQIEVPAKNVQIGDTIQIKAGEKVPLDGTMISYGSDFNTAALTGESVPQSLAKGDMVLAGMINLTKTIELSVSKQYEDSALARILDLVQEATARKARTEQFIRRFARRYTPIIVVLALAIVLIPSVMVQDYVFNDWLYRALVFLVLSCPCALVISIPLGYFGGIGAGARNGILFKGSNYLDLMSTVNTVVMDKTGTLTKGTYVLQTIRSIGSTHENWLAIAAALESQSTHPAAKVIVEHVGELDQSLLVSDSEELRGLGMKGTFQGEEILVGNTRMMDKYGIPIPDEMRDQTSTIVTVAIAQKLVGYVTIADEIKDDSKRSIASLHENSIAVIMLSGDKQAVASDVALQLNIDQAYGDLMPEQKVAKLAEIKNDKSKVVAFVGDGINDAPVLALSDVGIAMGAMGSDVAIETADVVIQTDQPSKVSTAIMISKATRRIVWQNIGFAFGVKAVVLVVGAGGLATMWEAVFADVGVALLAIGNAMRIQKMKF